MELSLSDGIGKLGGVGERRAALYRKLGVETIGDLLRLYPRDYLDLSAPLPVSELPLNETVVVKATVYRKRGEQRIRKGLSIFRVFASDGSGELIITIFNSKYMFDALCEEKEYYFYGKVTGTLLKKEMNSPQFFPADTAELLRPVYPLTEGLSNKLVQVNMHEALRLWGDRLEDGLPPDLRQERQLCQYRYAVENIHFPKDAAALSIARRRLVFEELFLLELGLLLLRSRDRATTAVQLMDTDIAPFLQALPFTLTKGQRDAINDSLADMQRDVPMNRLVQGDVGSGKTMVAAALCYACKKNGYQAAVMAPTQILAEQHYRTFQKLLAPLGLRCVLLTGTAGTRTEREELLAEISGGKADVVIGTHALVQEKVRFASLGLVITDEQHRFGVGQRAALTGKGDNPHLLVMSATPIPRTLALIIYGDLDISLIRELPAGRQPVKTFTIGSSKRGRALGFLYQNIKEGQQAYIVCPLIDENDSELVSLNAYVQALKGTPLSQCRIGALHGRMKPKEKESVMLAFQKHELDILVSTTVVEVGVDVPNATIMLIENAERFGLSQLHQLRGRVGRGEKQSWCFLLSDHPGEETHKRLSVMCATSDGFAIAEEDLKLRGPGDFFGQRQHGLPALKAANLAEDIVVLEEARASAEELLRLDAGLDAPEHTGLRQMVDGLFSQNGKLALN